MAGTVRVGNVCARRLPPARNFPLQDALGLQVIDGQESKNNGKNLGSNYCSRQPFLTHVSGCAAITISTDTSDASQGKHMVPAHANIACISVQNTREIRLRREQEGVAQWECSEWRCADRAL